MATVKIKFRASSLPDKAGTLFYQVIHNRVTRQIYTGYKLFPYEWNTTDSKIVIPAGCDEGRNGYLLSLREVLAANSSRLSGIIARLEKAGVPYHTDKVVELYNAPDSDGCFISFAFDLISRMTQIGKNRPPPNILPLSTVLSDSKVIAMSRLTTWIPASYWSMNNG